MKRIPFAKLSGAGNDFILIDRARLNGRRAGGALARRLCARRVSAGADGLLLVRRADDRRPAELDYYNADGSRAFCGNGTRCAAVWLRLRGGAGASFPLTTSAGLLACRVRGAARASVSMPAASGLRPRLRACVRGRSYVLGALHIGVPHAVLRLDFRRLAGYPVVPVGRALRRHPVFRPAGANINFIGVERGRLHIRTYERGVEDETLACGSGAAAAALLTAVWTGKNSPISVVTKSGDTLTVRFKKLPQDRFDDIRLEGPARIIYEGEICL
ncbi:MAG: diaminopimelate epimerase [Elusimicrobiota bacterium]